MTRLCLAALLGYIAGYYAADGAEAQACETELRSCADDLGEAEATLKRAQAVVRGAEIIQAQCAQEPQEHDDNSRTAPSSR